MNASSPRRSLAPYAHFTLWACVVFRDQTSCSRSRVVGKVRWPPPATSRLDIWHGLSPGLPSAPCQGPISVCVSAASMSTGPRAEATHSRALHTFCSSSFHLSSLPPWHILISEDWGSLWISASVCHWIASRTFTWTTSKGAVMETWET